MTVRSVHFARKVRMTLEYKGLNYQTVDGLLRSNPEALKAVNGRIEVPAFVDVGIRAKGIVPGCDLIWLRQTLFRLVRKGSEEPPEILPLLRDRLLERSKLAESRKQALCGFVLLALALIAAAILAVL